MKKILLTSISALFLIALLFNFFYFSRDVNKEYFSQSKIENNFSLRVNETMQFSDNMRYPSREISYKIENCSLQKENDFKNAIKILSNLTILSFYEVSSNENILVTCSEKLRVEEGFFIAGEGGPTKIVKSGKYNCILNGKVLLLKDSSCYNPNVAMHEIFHALGFEHSENKKNIMYNFSFCDQEISKDLVESINNLYKEDSLPDLSFENTFANFSKGILFLNFSIRNIGLNDSSNYNVSLFNSLREINKVNSDSLEIGSGTNFIFKISLKNRELENLTLIIEYHYKELNKENNLLVLKMNNIDKDN